ncbi:MAG: Acetamidase [Thelocarpon impressellum]|nr:MAG: Acetamidase [Thelocarpon impressellum]
MTDWEARAREKRDAVNALIPEEWRLKEQMPSAKVQKDITGDYIRQYLSPREVEITETDAVDLVQQTSSGQWKALETHCLHEIFFDAGMEEAQKLDDYLGAHGKPVGPLHGLPISLKDQFHVKGVETSMGYVGWIGTFEGQKGTGRERVFESVLVEELRRLGAVLFCKTSVPHSLMSGETHNNIVGYVTNPKNRHLTAGGSSGGEGALLSLRGSPAGFGSDLGGSIRIPAAFCGLYGLRPSAGRIPYQGVATSMDGQVSILPVVGPMAQSAASLRMLVKAVLSQEPWLQDPITVEMPWRAEQEQQVLEARAEVPAGPGLSFGLLRFDGMVKPQPPVLRALEMVKEALEKLGHRVIEWTAPPHDRLLDLGFRFWKADGGRDVQQGFDLSGEPMYPQVAALYGRRDVEESKAGELSKMIILRRQLQKEYMDYWNSTSAVSGTGRPVDAVICPVAPFAAAVPEKYSSYSYSAFVNVLDYTSCAVPVTQVDKRIDVVDAGYEPVSEVDGATWENYEPEMFDGGYVGVQLVGRRMQEEKVLALAELVGQALRG